MITRVWVEWLRDEDADISYLDTDAEYHYGKNGSNWDHVPDEVKAEVIEKYGSLIAACEYYADEDKQRLDAYRWGEWHMTGCIARATISYPCGTARCIKEFSSPGLWGIESDSDEECRTEVEMDQLGNLKRHLEQFGVDTANFWEMCNGR